LLKKQVLIPSVVSMRMFASLPCALVMAYKAYATRFDALCLLTTILMTVSIHRWKKVYTEDWTWFIAEQGTAFILISRITMLDVYRFHWPYSILWFTTVYVIMVMAIVNEFLWYTQTQYYHIHPINMEKIYTRYVHWKVCMNTLVSISATLGMSMR